MPSLSLPEKPICYTTSNENGVFVFKTVPSGQYYVKPYYKEQNIHYKPDKIEFQVKHDNVKLVESFEVIENK